MSDIDARLREKLITIQSLNQKMETLQAQLTGSQRRARELTQKVADHEETIAQKDLEIHHLKSEIDRFKGALERAGQEVKDYRDKQVEEMSKRKETHIDDEKEHELDLAERTIKAIKENLRSLSEAATAVLNEEPFAVEQLRRTVEEVGDPQFRVLNIILSRRAVRIDELASILVIDTTEALGIIDTLMAAGEVEMRDEKTVIPAAKYRETKIPKDKWETEEPAAIFDSLEDLVGKIEGHEDVAKAIEAAVDVLEQKLSRSGALVFEMRKTSTSWKKQAGDIQELKYTIRDWKARST